MAFPTIPTAAGSTILTAVQANTTATRTFPSLSGLTKSSGDLLIAIIVAYQSSAAAGSVFSGWTAGWTELADVGGTTSNMSIGVAYKWSDGTETTLQVTQAATITGHAAMMVMAIPGAHPTTPPAVGAIANGTSSAADPASLDPAAWGAEDTLWLAIGGSGETSTTGSFSGIGGAPANYTGGVQTGISSDVVGGVEGAVAFRQLNASSEDVGTRSVDTSNARNSALVVAVRPAPTPIPALHFDGADDWVRGGSPGTLTGDLTIAAIIRRGGAGGGSYHAILGAATAASGRALMFAIEDSSDSLTVFDASTNSNEGTHLIPTTDTDWWFVAVTKESGGRWRFHMKDLTTGAAMTHVDGTSGVTADPPDATGGYVKIGNYDLTPGTPGSAEEDFLGDIALVGWWNGKALTDDQVEELTANAVTADWWDNSAGRPSSLTELGSTSPTDLAGLVTWTTTGAVVGNTQPGPTWTFDGSTAVAAPRIAVDQPGIGITATDGGSDPSTVALDISDDGGTGSTVNWSAASADSWLTLDSSSGSVAEGATADTINLQGHLNLLPAPADELWVNASTGNDANDGSTPALAVATLTRANALATAGAVVHVAAGSYAAADLTTDGSAGSRIRYVSSEKWGAEVTAALTVTGDYIDVVDFDVTGDGSVNVGILINGAHSRAIGCKVHDMPIVDGVNGGAGILVQGSTDGGSTFTNTHQEVIACVVHDIGAGGPDVLNRSVHGIYVSCTDVLVASCLSYNNASLGIHAWHGSARTKIVNNTSVDNGDGILIGGGDTGVLAEGNSDSYVANNVSAFNLTRGFTQSGTYARNRFVNNISHGNGTDTLIVDGGGSETGTLTTDPTFVDRASDDYHLQSGSPGTASGVVTADTPVADLDWLLRDLSSAVNRGCFEATSSSAVESPTDFQTTVTLTDASSSNSPVAVPVTLLLAPAPNVVAIGQAVETDTAQTFTVHKAIGRAVETDTAQPFTAHVATGSAYADAVIADGPLAYWRLDETTGTVAEDLASTHDGTYTGTPTLAQSPLIQDGTSVLLSGDDYISVPHHVTLNPTAITVEAWAIRDASVATYDTIAMKASGSAWADGWGLTWMNSAETGNLPRLRWWVNGYNTAGQFIDVDLPADSAAHHVVGTYDPAASQLRMYLDGAEVAGSPVTLSSALTGSATALLLGNGAGLAYSWEGTLDEAAIYDHALTPTQVGNHYTLGTSSAGQSIAIGQALETDTAQPVSGSQPTVVAVGQALETDTAQPVTAAKAYTITGAADGETAGTLTGEKVVPAGQALEADTAQPLTASTAGNQVVAIGQVVESDTAQPLGHARVRAVGQALESDTAGAASARRARAVGQAVETDTAQPVDHSRARAIGQADEADAAQPVAPARALTVGRALETDTAQPLDYRRTLAIGQAVETDSAGRFTTPGAAVAPDEDRPTFLTISLRTARMTLTGRESSATLTDHTATVALTEHASTLTLTDHEATATLTDHDAGLTLTDHEASATISG